HTLRGCWEGSGSGLRDERERPRWPWRHRYRSRWTWNLDFVDWGQERAASLLPTLVKYEFALVQLFGLRNEVDVRPPGLLHVLETLRAFGVPHIALHLNATGAGRHRRVLRAKPRESSCVACLWPARAPRRSTRADRRGERLAGHAVNPSMGACPRHPWRRQ